MNPSGRGWRMLEHRCSMGGSVSALLFAVAVIAGNVTSPALSATVLERIRYSTDATVLFGSTQVGPQDVVSDDLTGTVVRVFLGDLPTQANLDAYELVASGDQLLSFDTTIALSG